MPLDVIVRTNEACNGDPFLLWDSVWSPLAGVADWTLAGGDEPLNRGGLAAKEGLFTAVVLSMFTDKRVPKDHPLAYLADGDPRGWWGDGVDVRADLFETDLGSLLWLLERAPLTDDTARWARQFTIDALDPLQRQAAVSRIDVQATPNALESRLELVVDIYGRAGSATFNAKFDLLWKQVQG